MSMIVSRCPKIVGLSLHGAYDRARLHELDAQLREARNAEIVLVDMRDTSSIDRESLEHIAHLRKYLQGVCAVRVVGANQRVRDDISAIGAQNMIEVLDPLAEGLAVSLLDTKPTRYGGV